MKGRAFSLQARQLLAASLGLVAFLGLTGYALDRAFVEAAGNTQRQRLQNYVWAYMRGTELLRNGDIIPPDPQPDSRFSSVGSGLYAAILADDFRWESESALGRDLPLQEALKPGEERYEGPIDTPSGPIYRQSMGMAWEVSDIKEVNVTVHVAENTVAMDRQVAAFRRELWVYLGAAGALLLALQILVLRWSLSPLRRVVGDMERITAGQKELLDGQYPQELRLLTGSLNELIDVGREQIARNRNILSDLAHSLKTPLAVIRSELDSEHSPDEVRKTVEDQVARMNEIVAYQLSRAATSGHQTFAAPLPIAPCAEEIVLSLEKVYASKNVLCEFDIDPSACFYGEQGDLMELLGNLLENAFKWANHRVLLTVRTLTIAPQRRAATLITVEDDGPGIAPENVDRLLQRGVRGDERVHGHGIGLAIVQDLVKAYRGELAVERSNELGGACFVVRFTPTL
ncbi:sensor histidine kinase [Xanthomonadaceae bacterium JHOS43]|nr:sensor histidine kinase [Xanthomonadaceae bacterium JHOS43]MCX7562440.1 sensor histidine kinase [Xanthomonadaceae bacterium XH05]